MTATERSISRGVVTRYAIGSIGTGGFATLPGLVLVYYLTDTLGVTALVAGLVVTAAKVWDVVIDPWIGERSDRRLVRTGTRRTWMVVGAIALPVGFLLTFAVPAGSIPAVATVWVFLSFLTTATAFSLFQVPYIALPAELTTDYDARTRLLTWRVVVLTIAILLFGAGGPELRGAFADEHTGYLVMALVAGVVIGVGMLVASTTAPKNLAVTDAAPRRSIRAGYAEGLAALRRSAPFRALLAAFVLQGLATGLMLAGAQFVATWVLRDEGAVTYLFVALIAPAVFAAPVWERVARRVGKERGFAIASVVFGVAALTLVGMVWAPGPWIYLPVAVAGIGYAGMQSLPMAMLPDVISHDARTHGLGRAGSFGGVWTAGETAGMALGATVLTIVLALTGYLQSSGSEIVTQSPTAVAGIALSFSVIPALLVAASLFALRRYPLRRSDIDADAAAAAVTAVAR
ncbi:MFS transporter [Agromyces ramosus]|uniref:GPH family glycoside/pentoside/hexuronide:cation symporter n=1 Tax=Agromyces ramosus TaxID=33879 RepID=A0ABU0R439_9MICO|nr:MFS transporter [Agromyces ramosus]MDQ0892829.1 GPH family glycoside/pentoside/hexuronide:cation symporter [Agromyces ramosus]